jgi:hypothetical protein
MDATELAARRFLVGHGLPEPAFEPDGNIPPDFLVDAHLAVEVRRLNQNVKTPTGREGLEGASASLFLALTKLLRDFGPPRSTNNWWVFYDFRRPLGSIKSLKREVSTFLREVLDADPPVVEAERRCGNLNLRVRHTEMKRPFAFSYGGHFDGEAGGWVTGEMISNVALCLDEKTAKIASYVDRYPRWWLVLVDRTGLGADADDLRVLPQHVSVPDCWERVVIIDSNDAARVFWVK